VVHKTLLSNSFFCYALPIIGIDKKIITQVDITLNMAYSKWYVKVYAYAIKHPALLVLGVMLLDRNAVRYVTCL
jgi:hypothetical protein